MENTNTIEVEEEIGEDILPSAVCTECGQEFAQEEGDWCICPDCTFACDYCGCRVASNELHTVQIWDNARYRYHGEHEVCPDCCDMHFTRCVDCNNMCSDESMVSNSSGESICRVCRENYYTCESCSNLVHSDNVYSDDDGCFYCQSCWDDRESSMVHNYSYNPIAHFEHANGEVAYHPRPGVFYHGIELEVGYRQGNRDDYAYDVLNALPADSTYLKEDSSIQNANVTDGFEIVTHPAELEWYRQNLPAIMDGSIPGLLSHNAGEGLGLHISVNRSVLSNHAIARICAFIGADRNEDWLVIMARRKSNQWAQIVKKTCIEDTLQVTEEGLEFLKTNGSRYEAVNLQNRSHIEFRLFRGTLKFNSAMLCLEFVNALCRWSMEPEEVQNYQSAAHLIKFAEQFPEEYPHLIDFLKTHLD